MSFSPPIQPGRVVEPAGGGSTVWFVVGLASLLAMCAIAVAVARRKRQATPRLPSVKPEGGSSH
jgi:hypothetical protein